MLAVFGALAAAVWGVPASGGGAMSGVDHAEPKSKAGVKKQSSTFKRNFTRFHKTFRWPV